MFSHWGIYCDWCGAADCQCDCLEQLQAFNRGRQPLILPPPKPLPQPPSRRALWLSFWLPVIGLQVAGLVAYVCGASARFSVSLAASSILYACIWLVRITRR